MVSRDIVTLLPFFLFNCGCVGSELVVGSILGVGPILKVFKRTEK